MVMASPFGDITWAGCLLYRNHAILIKYIDPFDTNIREVIERFLNPKSPNLGEGIPMEITHKENEVCIIVYIAETHWEYI